MRKSKLFMGLLSIAVILVSCSKDNEPKIDTSKAIRSGNFLREMHFEDDSNLAISHSTNSVLQNISGGVAEFEYTEATTRSLRSGEVPTITHMSLRDEQLVELEDAEYTLEFSYCYIIDPLPQENVLEYNDRVRKSIEQLDIRLQVRCIAEWDDEGVYYYIGDQFIELVKRNDDNVIIENDKWKTHRHTFRPKVSEYGKYWDVNFIMSNEIVRIDNGDVKFFIRNVELVKK